MPYKEYTRQNLADFTGRPVASFPEGYVTTSAFPQALLLFKLGTCLASPDDLSPEQKQLVDFAVLSMADAIHLSAPYQTALASPFNSESIGSYSYSRAAHAVSQGLPTGVSWFDMAIQQLSVCDSLDGIPMSMGTDIFGAAEIGRASGPGVTRYITDVERATSLAFGFDPSTGYVVPPAPLVAAAPSNPGPHFTGAWNPETTYVANQAVQHNGSMYFAGSLIASGTEPPAEPWQLAVQGTQYVFQPISRAEFEALPLPHPDNVLYIITD